MSSAAQLTIQRTTSFADRARAYEVRVDGVAVGTLRARQSITVPLPEGRHRLRIHIDWCSSNEVELDAAAGAHLAYACGSNLSGWRSLTAMFVVAFRPDTYLWLAEGNRCSRCGYVLATGSGDRCPECGSPRPA